jgi:hypothetical protein
VKLLIIGGYSAFDSLGTVVRAFQRRKGLEVAYLPTRPLRTDRKMTAEQAAEEVVRQAAGADVVLAWQVKDELAPLGFEALAGKCQRCWWTIDDPYLLNTEKSAYRDLADLVLTCSSDAVKFSRARGQAAELVWPVIATVRF